MPFYSANTQNRDGNAQTPKTTGPGESARASLARHNIRTNSLTCEDYLFAWLSTKVKGLEHF
jgi:hypothetical protein